MYWLGSFLFWIYRPAIGFITLAGLFIYLFLKKRYPPAFLLRKIFFSLVIFLLFSALFFSFLNAYYWNKKPITQKLLPPFTPISYVIRYSFQYYWWEVLMTILVSGIVLYAMRTLNKKFHYIFFYQEEPYLAAIGILLTGWPNCLFFFFAVICLALILHLVILIKHLLSHRKLNYFRLSFLNFWLPAALLTIIISGILNKWNLVNQFRI